MSFKIAMYLPATTGILAPPFTPNPYGKVEAPQLGVHPAYKNLPWYLHLSHPTHTSRHD